MTDALAAWFFRYNRLQDTDAVHNLRTFANPQEFERFIEIQRSEKHADGLPFMKNDDVTLLVYTAV